MAVFPAKRKRESRRIGESRRRAVNHFRDHRQCLAGSDVFQQQERREVTQLAIVRDRQHGAKPRQVHVLRAHIDEILNQVGGAWRAVAIRRRRPDDTGVRFAGEVLHRFRMPVIASRQPCGLVHALLDDRPLAALCEDEAVQVDLKTVNDRVVVPCPSTSCASPATAARGRRVTANRQRRSASSLDCAAH